MSTVVRVHLTGGDAELGSVPAADVAHLLLGVQAVTARASGAVLQRSMKRTGRWGKTIEDAVRFRLVGVEPGSVVGVLELPEVTLDPDQLDLDVTTLGESALIAALHTGVGKADHIEVARAFVKLTERLGIGTRYEALTFETSLPGVPAQVRIDAVVRERLEELVQVGATQRADMLVGVLFEADFESFTAKLRAPHGQPIAVSFDEDQADDIKQALREKAQLLGEVTYAPATSQAIRVDLRAINRAEQLGIELETDDFWTDMTVEQLQTAHSVLPVDDPDVLLGTDLTTDEADELLAALDS